MLRRRTTRSRTSPLSTSTTITSASSPIRTRTPTSSGCAYARPFSLGHTNWLMRASLPVNTYPVPPEIDHETGLGDLNVFAAYLIDTGNPALSVGIGPQITAPTASKDALGSEQVVGRTGAHALQRLVHPDVPVRLPAELAGELRGRRRPRRGERRRLPAVRVLPARRRHLPALDGGHVVRLREQTPTACRSGSASAR